MAWCLRENLLYAGPEFSTGENTFRQSHKIDFELWRGVKATAHDIGGSCLLRSFHQALDWVESAVRNSVNWR